MDTIANSVSLPNGEEVSVSNHEEPWWRQHGATGIVYPDQLSPDPDQPRRFMSDSRLEELAASIAHAGVRNPIVVTPIADAPWARCDADSPDAFFLVVSGHRRRRGAILSNLPVPIVVRVYASERDHALDRSVLNTNQEELPPLDRGFELARLQQLGWTQAELAKSFGCAIPTIVSRINLTKLDSGIQKHLNPELPRSNRLQTTIGGELGGISDVTEEELVDAYEQFGDTVGDHELVIPQHEIEGLDDTERRFALQRLLFAVIKKKSLGSIRAIAIIKDRKASLSSRGGRHHEKASRHEPRKRRAVVSSFVRTVADSELLDWPHAEWQRVFANATWEEIDELSQRVKEASSFLKSIHDLLEKMKKGKKPTSPEITEIMERGCGEAPK